MYLDFRGGRGVKKNTLYIVLQLLWPFSAGSLLDSLLGQYCLYSALLWAAEEEKSGTQWIPRDWCWVRHLIGTACVTWSCMEIATILLLLPPGPGFRCDFILLVCTNKSWHGGFELNQALFIQYIFTTSTSTQCFSLRSIWGRRLILHNIILMNIVAAEGYWFECYAQVEILWMIVKIS